MAQYDDETTLAEYNEGDKRLNYKDFEVQLHQYLLGLPRRCKEIFWLSRVDNLSNDEIADRFGISKRTVENQISQAQKHLRSIYRDVPVVCLSVLLIPYMR